MWVIDMTELGEKIKKMRLRAGLTQEQAAKILNVGRSTYTKYELGGITPSVEVLQKMAEAFKVPIYDFFQDFLEVSMSEAGYDDLDDLGKAIFWAHNSSADTRSRLIDMAETIGQGSTWREYIEGNAYSLGILPADGGNVSEMDTNILQAYHAAPADVQAAIRRILAPFEKKETGTAAS